MISELLTSIKATLYDRIVSPLSGAFLVSFLAINYKAVFLLFDDQDYYLKLNFLETALYPEPWLVIVKLFAAPLLSAAIFIVIYPWPARAAYQYWLSQQKKLKEIRVKIEQETPLDPEESRELRRKVALLENEFNEETRKRDAEIDDYKKLVVMLEEERKELQQRLESLNSTHVDSDDDGRRYAAVYEEDEEPEELQKIAKHLEEVAAPTDIEAVFRVLANSAKGESLSKIAQRIGISRVRVEAITEKCIKLGLMMPSMNGSLPVVTLTDEGKQFALDKNYA